MSDLPFQPVVTLAGMILRREISPVDLVRAVIDRIDRYDGILRSYITVCRESALAAAQEAEREIFAGRTRGPLHGIPVSHKDISWTKGIRTTANSRVLLDFVPQYDATHVRKLSEAGMILLGKTNTHEFACGDLKVFGTTRNPWDLSKVTGGSSAGSANAVAAGLAVTATGSDTGGSIRVPASFCGVVGLKPTYKRVSRYGVIPLSFSMDQVGPMTRTVADCALLFSVMAGYDPLDPTTSKFPVRHFDTKQSADITGVILGIPQEHFYEELDPEVDAAIHTALRHLENLGARLEPVALPRARDLSGVYHLLIMVEAFGNHAARLRAHGPNYGPRARRRISTGAFYTTAEHQQAAQIRGLWIRELNQVMQRVDALVVPTLPFPAINLELEESNLPDYSWGTRHFNLSGHPALSIPCGFTSGGLPIGMQLVSKAFGENTLFRIAHTYEQSTDWHKRRPLLEEVEMYAR